MIAEAPVRVEAKPGAIEVWRLARLAALWVNRFAFLFFTLLLLWLQFSNGGGRAHFSLYVSKRWHGSGYLLYWAVIYLFAIYALVLAQGRRYLTAALQLFSLALVVGVMRYPYNSVDHISLLPMLAAVQPIILYVDFGFTSWDDFDNVRRMALGIMIFVLVTPATFALMLSPVAEKILIYIVVGLLFVLLQRRLRAGSFHGCGESAEHDRATEARSS